MVGSAENVVVKAVKLELCAELELDVVDVITTEFVVEVMTLADVVSALVVELVLSLVVVVFTSVVDDVVEDLKFGHKAAMIPPFLTIPNNVFGLTLSAEQALLTHVPFAVKAD